MSKELDELKEAMKREIQTLANVTIHLMALFYRPEPYGMVRKLREEN